MAFEHRRISLSVWFDLFVLFHLRINFNSDNHYEWIQSWERPLEKGMTIEKSRLQTDFSRLAETFWDITATNDERSKNMKTRSTANIEEYTLMTVPLPNSPI